MPSATLARAPSARVGPGTVSAPVGYAPAPSTLLWSPTVLGRYAVAVAVGLVVVVGSWFGVGGKADWDDQRGYLSLSIAAFVVVSFGGLSLLLAGRRRIGLRRVALLGDLPVATHAAPVAATAAALVATGTPSSEVLVASDELVRYHRDDCPLVLGKGYAERALSEHAQAGRMPCGVCLP